MTTPDQQTDDNTPRPRPTTGPEFAAAHGNDSSTWTTADFDAEIVFAEIDAHRLAA